MTAQPSAPLPPEGTIPDLRALVEHAITNHPRSLQVALGPSEIGNACDRCLAHLLAGTPVHEGDAAWLPTLGTALHEWLEQVVIRHLMDTGTDRYIPEGQVTVGELRGQPITGHSDLFDTWTGTVVDYKLVGTTTMRKLRKSGPSTTYRRQAHLYGRGWSALGYDVRSVSIWFLPRNAVSLQHAEIWQEPYSEQVALDTLARAEQLAGFVDTFGLDAVLASAAPHTGEEFSCDKYPGPVAEPVPLSSLDLSTSH